MQLRQLDLPKERKKPMETTKADLILSDEPFAMVEFQAFLLVRWIRLVIEMVPMKSWGWHLVLMKLREYLMGFGTDSANYLATWMAPLNNLVIGMAPMNRWGWHWVQMKLWVNLMDFEIDLVNCLVIWMAPLNSLGWN